MVSRETPRRSAGPTSKAFNVAMVTVFADVFVQLRIANNDVEACIVGASNSFQ
jgi:hypothetical protein